MKEIILLGSTGSVGRNVLDVIRNNADKFRVKAISSNSNADLLAEQAVEFGPETVVIGDETLRGGITDSIKGRAEVMCGRKALKEIVSGDDDAMVFMAISGTAALEPLMAALERGKTVALASKEPVVSAGRIIRETAKSTGATIIPVDSEHSAVMQCMSGASPEDVDTLYITGSGGPLRSIPRKDFEGLSVTEVLDHPKWDMGPKITVDSATLMNKGLEMIEARWLFDISPGKIKVVIHPEALVHALVEFVDGTMKAVMFRPDMRFPILRALSHPGIVESDLPRVDLAGTGTLSFYEPDPVTFPALTLAKRAMDVCGSLPAVLNGANETAVKSFLAGKIKFTDIVPLVSAVMGRHEVIKDPGLDDIIKCERWASKEVLVSC